MTTIVAHCPEVAFPIVAAFLLFASCTGFADWLCRIGSIVPKSRLYQNKDVLSRLSPLTVSYRAYLVCSPFLTEMTNR
jgi:hypothetical protein